MPPRATFDDGWPPEITWDALAPHYATVGQVHERPVACPTGQWTGAHEADEGGRRQDRRRRPLRASSSSRSRSTPAGTTASTDAFDARHSERFVNAQGVEQGTCVHLGNCDIGCDVDAKNTLDRNYLALAETHGARRPPATIW